MKNETRVPYISIKIGQEVKTDLQSLANIKGMDLSKLVRAVLTNYIKPGTYSL